MNLLYPDPPLVTCQIAYPPGEWGSFRPMYYGHCFLLSRGISVSGPITPAQSVQIKGFLAGGAVVWGEWAMWIPKWANVPKSPVWLYLVVVDTVMQKSLGVNITVKGDLTELGVIRLQWGLDMVVGQIPGWGDFKSPRRFARAL